MATPRVETLALDCRALWGAEVELLSGASTPGVWAHARWHDANRDCIAFRRITMPSSLCRGEHAYRPGVSGPNGRFERRHTRKVGSDVLCGMRSGSR